MSVQVSADFARNFPRTLAALRELKRAIKGGSTDLAARIDALIAAAKAEDAPMEAVQMYASLVLYSGAFGSGQGRPVWLSDTDTKPVIPFFYTAETFRDPQLPSTQKPLAAGTILSWILDCLAFVPMQPASVSVLTSRSSTVYAGAALSLSWSQAVGSMGLYSGLAFDFSSTSDQATLQDTDFSWGFYPYGNSPPNQSLSGTYVLRTTSMKSVGRSVYLPVGDTFGIATPTKIMFSNGYQGGANMNLTFNLNKAPLIPGGLAINVEPFNPSSALYLPIVRGLLAVCQGKLDSVSEANVISVTGAGEYGSVL